MIRIADIYSRCGYLLSAAVEVAEYIDADNGLALTRIGRGMHRSEDLVAIPDGTLTHLPTGQVIKFRA